MKAEVAEGTPNSHVHVTFLGIRYFMVTVDLRDKIITSFLHKLIIAMHKKRMSSKEHRTAWMETICKYLHIPFWKKMSKRYLHQPGIEPGSPAWQASILPLNH
jgi:hypothetical protein